MINMQASRLLRSILKTTMAIGFLLMLVGPIARMNNEGFGDPSGSIQVSNYWERASYILIPTGAGIAILAAVLLVMIDRKDTQKRSKSARQSTPESQKSGKGRHC